MPDQPNRPKTNVCDCERCEPHIVGRCAVGCRRDRKYATHNSHAHKLTNRISHGTWDHFIRGERDEADNVAATGLRRDPEAGDVGERAGASKSSSAPSSSRDS